MSEHIMKIALVILGLYYEFQFIVHTIEAVQSPPN